MPRRSSEYKRRAAVQETMCAGKTVFETINFFNLPRSTVYETVKRNHEDLTSKEGPGEDILSSPGPGAWKKAPGDTSSFLSSVFLQSLFFLSCFLLWRVVVGGGRLEGPSTCLSKTEHPPMLPRKLRSCVRLVSTWCGPRSSGLLTRQT